MTTPTYRTARRGALAGTSPRTRAMLRHRRVSQQHRPGGPRLGRMLFTIALTAIIVVGSLVGIGVVAGIGVVGTLAQSLPDPTNLGGLTFSQPTIVYDRTGTIELARFQREHRRVVAYEDIPPLVLDATTTAEDRTFWTNGGFDAAAIVAAAFQNATDVSSDERGASTITQQLVRARLLPPDVTAGADRYYRKTLEIIQAGRLTSAFPGEVGKRQIVTAYLNEIYYGHEAYGIAAAAEIYFGVTDLEELTAAQAALLAGLAKAPSVYDPYRYAKKDAKGLLVVPDDSPPVVRRDYVLRNLSTSRWTRLTPAELADALAEPVVLAGEKPTVMKAPHFSWAIRSQLEQLLGGEDAVETGGFRVITTLDWDAQQLAERYLYAGAILPHLPRDEATALMEQMEFSKSDQSWIRALRGKDIHNGALVAIDYRHGDVLAYVGSAGYYEDELASAQFAPQHDAAAAGRQPGSAFKPILYATAFEERALTPGSLLLDITTDFGKGWVPLNADERERGPVLVRGAIQQSLNLPAIRALQRVGNESVADVAERMGIHFSGGRDAFLQSGLAGAIGTVETRPIDLVGAFGALANGGAYVPTRMILTIKGPDGSTTWESPTPKATEAVSPQSAFLMSNILEGNTDPKQNRWWSAVLALRNGADGERRPAAAKTGTADNRRDFSTYGYLAPPEDPDAPGLAVGVWMGNSDHSAPKAKVHATSLTTAGQVWHAFMRDYAKGLPIATFEPPDGVVRATIDRWTGGEPGPWTRGTVREWFLEGTEPGADDAVDEPGLLYTRACRTWMVDPVKAELGPERWHDDVADWLRRARRGVGIEGEYGSRTARWLGASSWGGPLLGPCEREKKDDDKGNGNGNGNGGKPDPTAPPPSPTPEPTSSPRLARRRLG